MRARRVPAASFDTDVNGIGRGHDRTGPDRKRADRNSRTIVHAIDLIDGEAFQQPILDHRRRTGATLFRGLKDDHRIAGEIPGFGEVTGRAKQHRGMPVMAACMHLSRRFGGVRQFGRLLDRQCVHIGAKPDHLDIAFTGRFASPDDADDTGAAKTRSHFVAAELPKPFSHECRSAVNVVLQFGMLMNIPAPGLNIGLKIGDAIDDGHGKARSKRGYYPV